MAKYGSPDVPFFLVAGRSLLAVVTDFVEDAEAVTEETTPLGATWPTNAPVGEIKATLSLNGFYDDSVGSIDEALAANEAVSQVVAYGVEGNTAGKQFVGLAGAYGSKYSRAVSRGALHKVAVTCTVSGNKDEGVILHPLGAETAAGDTHLTSVDRSTETKTTKIPITSSSVAAATVITTTVPHGLTDQDVVVIAGHAGSTPAISGPYTATVTGLSTFTIPVNVSVGGTGGTVVRAMSANGGYAYLMVPALTLGGYTNLAVLVKHSLDNTTFITLGTFTVVTTAPAAQRLVVAAATPVYRYLDCAWAWTGSGSGMSATFMVGFARG